MKHLWSKAPSLGKNYKKNGQLEVAIGDISFTRSDIYSLVRALYMGFQRKNSWVPKQLKSNTSNRPPLPLEIALYILRLTECKITSRPADLRRHGLDILGLESKGPLAGRVCFWTRPFTREEISKISGMQLMLLADNRDSKLKKHCSWLELAIYEPEQSVSSEEGTESEVRNHYESQLSLLKLSCESDRELEELEELLAGYPIHVTDSEMSEQSSDSSQLNIRQEKYRLKLAGSPENLLPQALRWLSHYNVEEDFQPLFRRGRMFNSHDDLLKYLTPGDRIAVVACVQSRWQAVNARAALLETWENYEPRNLELLMRKRAN